MKKESVGDKPQSIIRKATTTLAVAAATMLPAHSATHVFSSNETWDAFEGRAWNMRMMDRSTKATTFGAGEIPLLEKDAEHFIRKNPTVLESFYSTKVIYRKNGDINLVLLTEFLKLVFQLVKLFKHARRLRTTKQILNFE